MATVANHLPARCFLRDPKRKKSKALKSELYGGRHRACKSYYNNHSQVSSVVLGPGIIIENYGKPGAATWPAITSQVYHNNSQQLQCQHRQGNTQKAHIYSPTRQQSFFPLLIMLLCLHCRGN